MFLKKVCIFMALAFLAVDLLLLGIYLQARENIQNVSDKMIENAVTYYESNGVSIDERIIQRHIPDNAIYTFTDSNVSCAEAVAEKISGKFFSKSNKLSFLEAPDSVLYSIVDSEGIVLANLRVYNNSSDFVYGAGDTGAEIGEKYFSIYFKTEDTQLSGAVEKITASLMKCLMLDKKGTYTVSGVKEENGLLCVCAVRNVYGRYAMENSYVNLYFEGETLLCAVGNMIFADVRKSYKEELTDGVNALSGLDIEAVSEIKAEEIVYVIRNSGGDTKYLVPNWKITYIDRNGSEKIQYVDAIKN